MRAGRLTLWMILLAVPVVGAQAQVAEMKGDSAAVLRSAWQDMIRSLESGRDAIDDPALFSPPPTDRNLAEGYRYLMGFLYASIERSFHNEDRNHPYFRRRLQPFTRATADNADAFYLGAPIDGTQSYLIEGRIVGDYRHWKGAAPAPDGRIAAHYLWFGVHTHLTGDTGSLEELRPDRSAYTGTLDSSELRVEQDGTFTILLAPVRPEGFRGNFIATQMRRSVSQPDGPQTPREFTARYVSLREIFNDWEREEAVEVRIRRVGEGVMQPAPFDPLAAAQQLRQAGELANNQIRFWNRYWDEYCEVNGDRNGDGERFMPLNDLRPPIQASSEMGTSMLTNIYSSGVFELTDDEALVIEQSTPVPPDYMSFNVNNMWGESADYANFTSSLNGHQGKPDADGVRRYVVAHKDPGVPNWVDTTGLTRGMISVRWAYTNRDERPNVLPSTRVIKVPFAEIRKHLPSDTPEVSLAERERAIRIRQDHVQRRYRQY